MLHVEPLKEPLDFRVHNQTKRLKLGILGTELFKPGVTGIGGFGYALKQVSQCFSQHPELGVDTVILMSRRVAAQHKTLDTLHGSRILWRSDNWWEHIQQVRAEQFDLLLIIDNQSIFRLFYWAIPRVPLIFWIRDPWPQVPDKQLISTLRIPGQEEQPRGIQSRDMRTFQVDYHLSQLLGRKIVFAKAGKFVDGRFPGTYGFRPPQITYMPLPYIIDIGTADVEKASDPTVIVVGRLDPIKRPWVALALAERLPHVSFLFLGQNHFRGPGSWQPPDTLPANVKMLGHVDGEEKARLLSSAWLLLNTSIHEGLPITFIEALACQTPIVSCVNPDQVVSHFGMFVGEADGTGLQALPAFEEALRTLLNDAPRRRKLGQAGQIWARTTHNQANFLTQFHLLAQQAGVLDASASLSATSARGTLPEKLSRGAAQHQ
jgi:glycosyltransferase involved in cell wall biosynthesis